MSNSEFDQAKSFFATIFEQHAQDVTRTLSRRMDKQDVSDVVHDAFVNLLQSTDPNCIRNPGALFYRTAVHSAIDHHRKNLVRSHHSDNNVDLDGLATSIPGPEEIVEGQLTLEKFQSALAELPLLYRHAVLLNRIDGLTHQQIAKQLGISRKTVERYITKGLEHCRRRLAE